MLSWRLQLTGAVGRRVDTKRRLSVLAPQDRTPPSHHPLPRSASQTLLISADASTGDGVFVGLVRRRQVIDRASQTSLTNSSSIPPPADRPSPVCSRLRCPETEALRFSIQHNIEGWALLIDIDGSPAACRRVESHDRVGGSFHPGLLPERVGRYRGLPCPWYNQTNRKRPGRPVMESPAVENSTAVFDTPGRERT